jgi:hypothetical protein
MQLREIYRSHGAVRSTILTDAMSPGIGERKERKMPKEDFWKGSLHYKYGHKNKCGTLAYRLSMRTCTMLAPGRLGQPLQPVSKECGLRCFWRHLCELCSFGRVAGWALAKQPVFYVQPKKVKDIFKVS